MRADIDSVPRHLSELERMHSHTITEVERMHSHTISEVERTYNHTHDATQSTSRLLWLRFYYMKNKNVLLAHSQSALLTPRSHTRPLTSNSWHTHTHVPTLDHTHTLYTWSTCVSGYSYHSGTTCSTANDSSHCWLSLELIAWPPHTWGESLPCSL